ncbi:hypothetical protein F5X99DRAFT_428655 [Biscogniauxia marginata]|nr:hypothetical protein F5X99DRAFT_428655 [Biscogniauxia marginata]
MPVAPVERETPPKSPIYHYKYHLLVGTYVTLTSLLFYRVRRQPFSAAIKSEQYETIFKGTTLAAVVGGVFMSDAGRAKYRQYYRTEGDSEMRTPRDKNVENTKAS